MKFGGTSVADAEAMSRVIAIVRDQLARSAPSTPPVVVVSAMSKVTDRLIESARLAGDGSGEDAAKMLNDLLERHSGVAKSLVAADRLAPLVAQLSADFSALMETVRTLARHREVSPSSHDAIVAMGELASSRIVAAAFASEGVQTAWIDSLVTAEERTDHPAGPRRASAP